MLLNWRENETEEEEAGYLKFQFALTLLVNKVRTSRILLVVKNYVFRIVSEL